MINIDVFTLGNEFKDEGGNIYKVSSNFSDERKIFVELTPVLVEPEELIKET